MSKHSPEDWDKLVFDHNVADNPELFPELFRIPKYDLDLLAAMKWIVEEVVEEMTGPVVAVARDEIASRVVPHHRLQFRDHDQPSSELPGDRTRERKTELVSYVDLDCFAGGPPTPTPDMNESFDQQAAPTDFVLPFPSQAETRSWSAGLLAQKIGENLLDVVVKDIACLLYTSPSPRD